MKENKENEKEGGFWRWYLNVCKAVLRCSWIKHWAVPFQMGLFVLIGGVVLALNCKIYWALLIIIPVSVTLIVYSGWVMEQECK